MIAFGLTLTLTFGGGWTLDINPRAVFHVDIPLPTAIPGAAPCGLAIPHVALVTTNGPCGNAMRDMVQHETRHFDQYDALGPAFLAVYALTGGQAIEDYLGPPGSTWFPPEGEPARCPLVRVEPDRATFAPCWRPA